MSRILSSRLSKVLALSVFTTWLALGTTSMALAELPQISEPRIVQPPPGAKVAAAYFTISNPDDKALIITNVRSNGVARSELHLSSVVNDVAKMEKQESIVVEAGNSLQFKPGSYHVMLMGLEAPLEAGDTLSLVLETNVGELTLDVPIITPDESAAAMQSEHSMHKNHSAGHGHDGTTHTMDDSDSMNADTVK